MINNFSRLISKFPTEFTKAVYSEHLCSSSDTQPNTKTVLLQLTANDFYYGLMSSINADLIAHDNVNVKLLITRGIDGAIGLSIKSYLKRSIIFNRLYMRSWKNLFSKRPNNIHYPVYMSVSKHFNAYYAAILAWRKWRSNSGEKKQVSYNGIRLDDLVIDTYLRYRPATRFMIDDFFVLYILKDAILQILNVSELFEQNKISSYVTSYASYTVHGVPVRVALKYGAAVYSLPAAAGVFQRRLTVDFPYHTFNPSLNEDITRPKVVKYLLKRRTESKNQLKYRFRGGIDPAIAYMRNSSYNEESASSINNNLGSKAILFLHDFVDSPNIYDGFVYDDFYQWATDTINSLIALQVPFAIKPHPNQVEDSHLITKQLQQKYQSTCWIPSTYNNLDIIRSKPRVGLTVYGTIASELAYFGIPSICCSQHPHQNHNFCRTATSVEQYHELLKKIPSIDLSSRDQVRMRHEAIDYFTLRNYTASSANETFRNAYATYWADIRDSKASTTQKLHNLRQVRSGDPYKSLIKALVQ